MNRKSIRTKLMIPALLTLATTGACSKEEPPPPPPQASNNFQQQDFQPQTIEPTRVELDLAQGVTFPEAFRPSDDTLSRAVASLANAMISGDVQAMSNVLTNESQAVLNTLVENSLWTTSTDRIEAIRVVSLDASSANPRLGLAIQEGDGAYLLAWDANNTDGPWVFNGLAIEPRNADTAEQLDGAIIAPRATPSLATLEESEPAPTDNAPEEEDSSSSSNSGGRNSR
ncbi:MAG: hypothetical protein ACYTF7_03700 [Planctomycetota bacterium]|jgi:hypothetical protein